MINLLIDRWRRMEGWAERHHILFKRCHHCTHLAYFSLVVTSGPYQIAAGVLLILGLVAWALHLEGVE